MAQKQQETGGDRSSEHLRHPDRGPEQDPKPKQSQNSGGNPDPGQNPAPAKPVRMLWGSPLAYKIVLALMICGFLFGLAFMLRPFTQRLYFAFQSAHLADRYNEAADPADPENEKEYQRALEYNRQHAMNLIEDPFSDDYRSAEYPKGYGTILDPMGNGMMGVLDIPKIHQRLCVYHGTAEDTLLRGIGHISGTSLPVGGESTHCVLTGHRGLAAAELLTDLDQMKEGDQFYLHVLGHDLAYEVDQILTVLPSEVDALQIEPGKDLCTLVTCTPYAVNSHRLLVRGHRVPYVKPSMPFTEALRWLTPLKIALIAAAVIVIIILLIRRRKRRREQKNQTKEGVV